MNALRRWCSATVAAGLVVLNGIVAPALDVSVGRVNGDVSAVQLGPGTGIIIGIVDGGVDDLHPALAGNDSLGRPRMVAEANFVTTESTNTGNDVYGHGTAVAGVVLGRDVTYRGMAPDARFVNARVLDSHNSFQTDAWVANGTGFAVAQGAQIINLSMGYAAVNSLANSKLSLMSDYLSYGRSIPVVVSAGNNGVLSGNSHIPRGPGDAYNVFSTAATEATAYDKVVSFSSWGPTQDGRSKPDLAAPGQSILTASDDWQTGGDFASWSGTSFAAPHVSGLLASQMQYGLAHSLSVDPLVLKATMLNSAEKVNDRNDAAWSPQAITLSGGVETATQPLNSSVGAGQIDGAQLALQYAAGEQGPGTVSLTGWDLNVIIGLTTVDYLLGPLSSGDFTATLSWNRHVGWTDDGDGLLDSADTFGVLESLDNLNLSLLRDGSPVAASASTSDNVEHIFFAVAEEGTYSLRVERLDVVGSGASETYALAWNVVPEPGTLAVLIGGLATGGLLWLRQRRQVTGGPATADDAAECC